MITILFFIFVLHSQTVNPQTAQISVNDLFIYFNADLAKVKTTMAGKGYKISYDGDKFGKVQFYQWYHGRTSYNADAFLQRYTIPGTEEYNWYDDCLEYIIYNPDEFVNLKKQCEAIKMKLLDSGQKEFTYDDSYTRDPGTYSIYQNDKYWIHFNAVQESDKIAYKILLRKKPSL
jgi:hypothetical protein